MGASITSKHLGFDETDVKAAEAYDRAAISIRGGAKAFINFDRSRSHGRRSGRHPSSSPTSGGIGGRPENGVNQEKSTGNGSFTQIVKAAEPALPSNGRKYRGVSFMYKSARWRACLVIKGKPQHLGLFRNAKEAALVYDAAALKAFGSSAVVNFDLDGKPTEHSTPGHGGLYGEHALTPTEAASSEKDKANKEGQVARTSKTLLVGGVPWPRIGEDDYQVSNDQMLVFRDLSSSLHKSGASDHSSSLESSKTKDKYLGKHAQISDERSKSATSVYAPGQLVDSIFGRGEVVDYSKSNGHYISIKLKWGVVYAASPSSIGLRRTLKAGKAQTGVEEYVGAEDENRGNNSFDKDEDSDANSDDSEDKTPKDTHYGTLLNEQRSADISKWTPKEKALFEVAMWECDKDFTEAARIVRTKSSSDCAEYYYCYWKMARSHRKWKQVSSDLVLIMLSASAYKQ